MWHKHPKRARPKAALIAVKQAMLRGTRTLALVPETLGTRSLSVPLRPVLQHGKHCSSRALYRVLRFL